MSISLKKPTADLFDDVAEAEARRIAGTGQARPKAENKPTQLRRFYDEIVLWEMRVNQQPEKFDDFLPLIRMMNAKAAYAQGRGLVDATFTDLLRQTLAQVEDAKTMTTCKQFWEAFMGFYKLVGKD
jgi:CRISPR-associated protein Csm2